MLFLHATRCHDYFLKDAIIAVSCATAVVEKLKSVEATAVLNSDGKSDDLNAMLIRE